MNAKLWGLKIMSNLIHTPDEFKYCDEVEEKMKVDTINNKILKLLIKCHS